MLIAPVAQPHISTTWAGVAMPVPNFSFSHFIWPPFFTGKFF